MNSHWHRCRNLLLDAKSYGGLSSGQQQIAHPDFCTLDSLFIASVYASLLIGARDVQGRSSYCVTAPAHRLPWKGFKDSRKYPERLKEAMDNTGETDALVCMGGAIMGIGLVAACFEFEFMGGSMGSVVGERFVRGVHTAMEQKVPFVCFTVTGGARMQEGLLSLVQMAKPMPSSPFWPKRACPTSAC